MVDVYEIYAEKTYSNGLNDTKHKEKVNILRKTIDNDSERHTEFDDSLFSAFIDKVIIKAPKHFRFIFEGVVEMKVKMWRNVECSSRT